MATIGEALDRARQLLSSGDFSQAEAIYRQLVEAIPQAADFWHELGIVYLSSQRGPEAVECLRRAVELDPRVAAYHSNLGAAYRQQKQSAAAVDAFRQALALGPPTAEVYNNLALAMKDTGQTEAALNAFDQALRIRPDFANGYFNRGNLRLDVGSLTEAIDDYRRVLAIDPHDAGAYCKLGVAYYDLARFDEALESFDAALRIQPNYPEVRRNRALVYLTRGDFDKGWHEFEWRVQCEGYNARHYPQPRWLGQPLAGRSLFVTTEQGLGDTLQFIRYAGLIQRQGGRPLIEVPKALLPVLSLSGFGPWLVGPDGPGTFDMHCPLMSLAGFLGNPPGHPVWEGPYLKADAEKVASWKQRLASLTGLKVGVAWAGNPDHPHDRFRSVSLEQLAPLAAVPGVQLISLHPPNSPTAAASGASSVPLVPLPGLDASGGAFMDTAAVIKCLDLVITVDTSLAHLAGGLGAPVWVALQLSPDWRWQSVGDATPWYPTMRLFRQSRFHDWPPVFARIAQALSQATRRLGT